MITVYGAHSLHPDRYAENGRMLDQVQEHLAVIGRVPWLCAGDWNIEPSEFAHMWNRPGTIRHTGGPTQNFGANLDWFLTSPGLRTMTPRAEAIPGTDHASIWTTIPGDQQKTLGYRLTCPRGFTGQQLETAKAKLAGQA